MKNYLIKGSIIILALGFALPALAADTTRPVIGAPSPDTATVGVVVNVTAGASDSESGIASCNLYMDNEDVGAMGVSSGIASKSFVFTEAGVHTMFVFCRDAANNFNSGQNGSILVSAAAGDSAPPSIGSITPTTATAGFPASLSLSVTDSQSGVSSCLLYVDSWQRGTMAISSGTAGISYNFQEPGNYLVYGQCFDGAGNSAAGQAVVVTVTPPTPPNPSSRLVKLACPAGVDISHPCKAVYYQAADGKRHAFPNDKVFFSWYADFSDVQVISSNEMASLQLGKQVTYRPGYKMVKFTTVNKVYAVAKHGMLRWITSEAAATQLYGNDWNTKVDDISDAFFTNYSFGPDIVTADNYSPSVEMAGAATIDASL